MWHAVRHQGETRSMTSAHRALNKATESEADLSCSILLIVFSFWWHLHPLLSRHLDMKHNLTAEVYPFWFSIQASMSRVSGPELITTFLSRCGFRFLREKGTDWWVQGLWVDQYIATQVAFQSSDHVDGWLESGHCVFIGQCRDKSPSNPHGYIYDTLVCVISITWCFGCHEHLNENYLSGLFSKRKKKDQITIFSFLAECNSAG